MSYEEGGQKNNNGGDFTYVLLIVLMYTHNFSKHIIASLQTNLESTLQNIFENVYLGRKLEKIKKPIAKLERYTGYIHLRQKTK
ncbi:hypothetical protein CWI37_0024p0040 [Hamiltosporidium tvaerminnensis]|uniref:Uncharacterized protein n=1 Tax=Hamiltosporidium tvaerminnensis TaxID=1176355 RepID=A0A4Q9LEQ2_9MICR|nr:hypothetical protein CWI37_0024p0040 [Hamiltosporidium tvaerminnensis]